MLVYFIYLFTFLCQIDLINMTQSQDGEYKLIGHVMDHFSKFHILFPMCSKEAVEVADNLAVRVFSYFGMLYILQSDNGTEFVNKVIKGLLKNWDGLCKTINGRPRHPQSQGAVERGNQEIERIIGSIRKSTKQNKWSSWCPQIQYEIICFGPYVFYFTHTIPSL